MNANSLKEIKPDYVKTILHKDYRLNISRFDQVSKKDLRLFIDSLILSSKAKKYLISYLIHSKDENVLEKCFTVCCLAFGAFYTHSNFWPKLNKNFSQKSSVIFLFFLIVIFMCSYPYFVMLYSLIQNGQSISKAITKGKHTRDELKVLQNNSAIDDDYYDGAIEYYQKLRQRNIAVRNIALSKSKFSKKRFQIKKNGEENCIYFFTPNVNHDLKYLYDLKNVKVNNQI